MILSRTMRPSDYTELQPELNHLNNTIALCGPVPYTHRRWEYALIQRAVKNFFPNQKLEVADFGCSDGLSPAMMLREGHNVSLYELWDAAYGDRKPDAIDKANKASLVGHSGYRMIERPLGKLIQEDKGRYDVALCISVIEHIKDEEGAFNDMLDSVKAEKGMVLLTMDFHPSGVDNLYYHWLRHRIYNEASMKSLQVRGEAKGFRLLDGSDWSWAPNMIMVQNEYGFSSIVLVKG